MSELILCLIITVVVVQTWLVERFVVPSGSMAETLRGVHRSVVCPDCGCTFAAGEEENMGPAPERAACPNCGNPFAPLAELPAANGDRLLVLKTAFDTRLPRRWEVIVFRCPEVAHQVYVKRVVGLPGEEVQIVGGDVYVDGRIERKSLAECQAMAVVVYDDQHQPRHDPPLPPRFAGDGQQTRWQADGTRYLFAPPSVEAPAATSEIDWLSYRNWRRQRGLPDRTEEVPINDDLGYNQGQSRLLNYTGDVGLRCRIRCHGHGELWLAATDGREQFRLRIVAPSGLCELYQNGRPIASRETGRELAKEWADLELLLFDRQVQLALDGEPLLPPVPYEASSGPLAPTSRPLAVGARGLYVELDKMQVVRDVYYTQPETPAPWGFREPYRLAADEWFVLGDNSSLSEDSRYWAGVRTELLVGKPFLVHMPSQAVDWGRLRLQFPSAREVRYIR